MILGPSLSLALSILAVPLGASAGDQTTSVAYSGKSGFAGDTVVIMRHAEKPDDRLAGGSGLSLTGQDRATAYVDYFRFTNFGDAPLQITDLIAATDTPKSARPRLTLTPLGKVLGLPVQQPFADDQVGALAGWLASGTPHRTVLVAWRHHVLPRLLVTLGADPALLLPDGNWPKGTFDWLIVLKYDAQGKLKSAERLLEAGMDALGSKGAR